MVNAKERRQVVEDFEREPLEVLATKLKCAVCIAFIGGIVVIGYQGAPTAVGADVVRAAWLSSVAAAQHADRVHEPTQGEYGP